MLLDGILHRKQQAQQQIVGQIVLVHGKEGNNIANLAIDANGRTAGIAVVAILNPHFGTKHQKGHIVLTRYADAGCTHILLQHTHALNIFNNSLEEGHGIVFDNIAIFINQQHAQIMNIKMLLALFI